MHDTALHRSAATASRDLRWAKALFVLSVVLTAAAAAELLAALLHQLRIEGWFAADEILFLVTCAVLLFGNIVHQLARLGLARRFAAPSVEAVPSIDTNAPSAAMPLVTILVPAYKEEPEIVLRTLLSAACQTYARRRIVLLLDDPPNSPDAGDRERLDAMRAMPERIADLLAPVRDLIERERADFMARGDAGDQKAELACLLGLADAIGFWLTDLSRRWVDGDHMEQFFAREVVQRLGRQVREQVGYSVARARVDAVSWRRLLSDAYGWLENVLTADVAVFERKRYAYLSHEANKAMNLNSYIGCLGRHLAEERVGGVLHLVETTPARADLATPWSPYLLTLDADSVLLPEYTQRLVAIMEQPCNARVAVLQTPYATFPGAMAPVERIAGATTDVQLLLHQGYSYFEATFWVGANALIRRAALDDIAVTTVEHGHPVTRYIQDRTVIEDTESTLDLVGQGWGLHNHPERLAYSATPADFGTLIIQRRRWACGGLLILPKLLRQAMRRAERGRLAGLAIRFHYLASLAYGPLAVLLMLLFPFEDTMDGMLLPLTALPYFVAYGRDLVALGYRWRDLFSVYALNLLLVPIHFAGSFASIRQALTGRKTPFRRTPKVAGRIGAPRHFVLVAWALPAFCGLGAVFDLWLGNMLQGMFAALNGIMFAYAALVFVGARASLEDVLGTSNRLLGWLNRRLDGDGKKGMAAVPAS